MVQTTLNFEVCFEILGLKKKIKTSNITIYNRSKELCIPFLDSFYA